MAKRNEIYQLLLELRPIVQDAIVEPGGVYQGRDLVDRLDVLLDELEED
jgi:hypothetical protein